MRKYSAEKYYERLMAFYKKAIELRPGAQIGGQYVFCGAKQKKEKI